MTENCDFEQYYKKGLDYLYGRGVKSNIDYAIENLKIASNSKKHWMINDYALALINRGLDEDLNDAINSLKELSLSKNSQSLRLMGLAYMVKDPDYEVIGECLLLYSADLGNQWAFQDLIKFRERRRLPSDITFIKSIYNTEMMKGDVVELVVFKAMIGYYGGKPDVEKASKMYSLSNSKQRLLYIQLIRKSNNPDFAEIILNDIDSTDPPIIVEIARMYRDGGVLKKSHVMYEKICDRLPENYQKMLEEGL